MPTIIRIMDVSRLEMLYVMLGVMLVLTYIMWTDAFGYSEGVFFLLLLTLGIMAHLYMLFILHFRGPVEVNIY